MVNSTSSLIQSLFDRLKLCLKFLVLSRQAAICILKESLQILNALIPSQKLAFCNSSLFLEHGVLVDQLS